MPQGGEHSNHCATLLRVSSMASSHGYGYWRGRLEVEWVAAMVQRCGELMAWPA